MEGGVTVTSHHLQAHLHVGEIEEVVDVLRRRVFVVGDKKLQDKKIAVNVTSSKTQSEAIRIGPGPRCAHLRHAEHLTGNVLACFNNSVPVHLKGNDGAFGENTTVKPLGHRQHHRPISTCESA